MAITYPLALPTATGIRNIAFRARNAVAYNFSPFTFRVRLKPIPVRCGKLTSRCRRSRIVLTRRCGTPLSSRYGGSLAHLQWEIRMARQPVELHRPRREAQSSAARSAPQFLSRAPQRAKPDTCFRAIMCSSEADRQRRFIRCLLMPTLMVLAILLWRYGRG